MSIIVTGAAGFIGANLVKALNNKGHRDIIIVDHLVHTDQFKHLVYHDIADYIDPDTLLEYLKTGYFGKKKIEAIFHQGACSDTMERNAHYMMANNYRYSLALLEWSQENRVPFLYASSAAVYGSGTAFKEERDYEAPLNVYGYSKFLFDHIVRTYYLSDEKPKAAKAPITGFRYFNVYGPYETHKGRMASVAWHHFHQYQEEGKVKLFEGSHGCENGEQQRDFVFVEDVANVNLHFLENPVSGIFNLGTGGARSFNALACAVVNALEGSSCNLAQLQQRQKIEYIPFPEALLNKYQAWTQADLTKLREAGYTQDFTSLEEGVSRYMEWLRVNEDPTG